MSVRFHHWRLGFRQSSFHHIARGLQGATLHAFRWPLLFRHALVPSSFRLQVNRMTQKLPFELLLTASGIQHRVPRRTLSPHPALPLWSISSHTLGAFLPISSASTVPSRWTACAFAAYLCSGSFPKAGGLRHQSSSSCARLSRTQTTMPPLTSQEGIGFSYGSRLPTSTILPILPGISRVPTVGFKRDDVGGVFTWCPFRSLRLPRLFTG
jgi:hypothetical protein